MLISFFFFFALFTLVGMATYFVKKSSVEDYFLASRSTPNWLVALSYGATISSGATFIGFAGLAYATGVTAFVSVAALTLGDYVGWKLAGHKIREMSVGHKTTTYPSLVGKMTGQPYQIVTIIAAVMTVVFLGAYCSAQMVAGAKIGVQLFGWDFNYLILGGAAILLAYCWSGGIRASIWTDAVQAIIIFLSLLVLIVAGVVKLGGVGETWLALQGLPDGMMNILDPALIAVAVGWFFFGVAVLGQPQLMVRHMAAKSNEAIDQARVMYFSWRCAVLFLSCLSGLMARVLIPDASGFDPELSIPQLWQDLLPPVLVGFLLAGLFSATMSTADSLLLAASSSLTQQLIPAFRNSYALARLGTVIVISLIVIIALFANKGVLALVILAWTGLASSVAPLVIVQLLGFKPNQRLAVTMMVVGFMTSVFWEYGLLQNCLETVFGLLVSLSAAIDFEPAVLFLLRLALIVNSSQVMSLVPGMLAGFAVFAVGHAFAALRLGRKANA